MGLSHTANRGLAGRRAVSRRRRFDDFRGYLPGLRGRVGSL